MKKRTGFVALVAALVCVFALLSCGNPIMGDETGSLPSNGNENQPAFSVGIGNGKQVPVHSAEASEAQPGEPIELSFDGNPNTMYHSRWGNGTKFPVTLSYYFQETERIDYLRHFTRLSGTNGNIQELEIWVADGDDSIPRKYGDFNFNGVHAQVIFDPPLINPTLVEYRVNSGMGNWVSVGEVQFFQHDPEEFNYLTIFTDHSVSALRPGVTLKMITGIPDPFFKDMALKIFSSDYDPFDFRVQDYRAWIHPSVPAAANKTNQQSLHDNPTGILARKGQELIVFVSGLEPGQPLSIFTEDLKNPENNLGVGARHTYRLFVGINKISALADGLIYVQYYSPLEEMAPKAKIHFATGEVNGLFDVQRHTRDQWRTLLGNAIWHDFDLVGEYAHLVFPVNSFKKDTADGLALAKVWDDIVRLQHEFLGIDRQGKAARNRLFAHVNYHPDTPYYMAATNNHTLYRLRDAVPKILDPGKLRTSNIWGPAHEVGHMNQVRPGMAWNGVTEVTVNLFSLHVQTSFGNLSGLENGDYARTFDTVLGKGIPLRKMRKGSGQDHFGQLVPFWQLKLYLVDALGQTRFYQDMFHHYMSENPKPAGKTDGRWQLHFVRTASRISGYDLTHFFEQWGFLTPIDESNFIITQKEVDALRVEIDSWGLPQPPKDFTRITDKTVGKFRS
ncbi:MAG: M60 family metallopeptidase [Treponema sp.]|nr:M60 family metallopeptidase [Treponema sp.]